MKRKQLIAMWCGIIAIVLMGLFPPWHVKTLTGIESQQAYGFAFILTPPRVGRETHPMINIPQLLIQYFVVGLITTGYIITLNYKKPKDEQKE